VKSPVKCRGAPSRFGGEVVDVAALDVLLQGLGEGGAALLVPHPEVTALLEQCMPISGIRAAALVDEPGFGLVGAALESSVLARRRPSLALC
jgi:hypothetical protein